MRNLQRRVDLSHSISGQTFNVKIDNGKSQTVPVTLQRADGSTISVNFDNKVSDFHTKIDNSSIDMDISSSINNSPEDDYYDEIIYYDGGGVEGYGD